MSPTGAARLSDSADVEVVAADVAAVAADVAVVDAADVEVVAAADVVEFVAAASAVVAEFPSRECPSLMTGSRASGFGFCTSPSSAPLSSAATLSSNSALKDERISRRMVSSTPSSSSSSSSSLEVTDWNKTSKGLEWSDRIRGIIKNLLRFYRCSHKCAKTILIKVRSDQGYEIILPIM